ncbi:hypothetical protein KUCAC02_009416 [Chaenocephalus aceratus]|uniref:Uncharacterized protein n=1 Tax=Chaenocephalus aceratus TaxID=36190 RepID=A0ACB9WU50_CHAAC|nr:hypothetical protein KUCAC02_009416 [Chaenocephalus aceratus]
MSSPSPSTFTEDAAPTQLFSPELAYIKHKSPMYQSPGGPASESVCVRFNIPTTSPDIRGQVVGRSSARLYLHHSDFQDRKNFGALHVLIGMELRC